MDAPVTYAWEGAGRKQGPRVLHDAVSVRAGSVEVTLRVGSTIFLQSPPGELPYVALIEGLYETPGGKKMMNTRWFYRVSDLPRRLNSRLLLVSACLGGNCG
jgi:hypothetical protein